MAWPEEPEDSVNYGERELISNSDLALRMVDGSRLDIWGNIYWNGEPFSAIRTVSTGTDIPGENELVITPDDELIVGNGTSTADQTLRSVAVKNEPMHLFRTGGIPFSEDPTFDNTAAFNAAIAIANAAAGGGGGTIQLGPHIWGIAGQVTVLNKVNIVGPGGSTHGLNAQHLGGVRAIHANAQLRFGSPDASSGATNRGAYSGGFSVYGADISNRSGSDGLFVVGNRAECEISNISVTDTVGNAVYVSAPQNSVFSKWNIARAGGVGLLLDTFTLACVWDMLTIRAVNDTHLKMINTNTAVWGSSPPGQNLFIKTLFEDAKLDTTVKRVVDLQASDNNQFIGCQFVTPPLEDTAISANFIANGQNAQFHGCKWVGKNRTMEAILRVEGTMMATGFTSLDNSVNGIFWKAPNSSVRLHGHVTNGGITNFWHPSSDADKVRNFTGLWTSLKIYETLEIDKFIRFNESATVPSMQNDEAALYAIDNGSGKTQLVVRFKTGAAIVLATEP